jgi:hypothetical protein
MTDKTEPTTEAGRRVWDRAIRTGHLDADQWAKEILAIEDEARAAEPPALDVERLANIILDGGLRLPGFDHWRESRSTKPSDPDDERWVCVCGVAGSPEFVQRHWAAMRAEYARLAREGSDGA